MTIKKTSCVLSLLLILVLATVYSLHLRGQLSGPEPSNIACSVDFKPFQFCPTDYYCNFNACSPCINDQLWCNDCGSDGASSCGSDYYCEEYDTRPDGTQRKVCRKYYEDDECSYNEFPYKYCDPGEKCKQLPGTTNECRACTAVWCNMCKLDDDCLSGYICERGVVPAQTTPPLPDSGYIENNRYRQCKRTEGLLGRECDTDVDCIGSHTTFCTAPQDKRYCYTEWWGKEVCFEVDECVQRKKSCVPSDPNNLLSQGYCNYLEPKLAVTKCKCDPPAPGPGVIGGSDGGSTNWFQMLKDALPW